VPFRSRHSSLFGASDASDPSWHNFNNLSTALKHTPKHHHHPDTCHLYGSGSSGLSTGQRATRAASGEKLVNARGVTI
ncbi:MAG: hypothetical protein ACODAD_02915, partial [Planctomycetota bacterium]